MKRASGAALLAMLVCSHTAIAAPGDEIYEHPGKLVSAGDGARLNMVCMGRGSPAVVFDSGFEDWAPAWAAVQPRVAKFTRACSYDRAGAGFSTPGPMPRTNVRIADQLHTALRNAGIKGPYILVASAFGSYNVRAFADRYTRDVAGLVMVDADATDLEPKALQDSDRSGRERITASLRACRAAIAAGKPLPMLPSRPGRPRRDCSQVFYRGLPSDDWSPALNAALAHIANTNVAMYDADISEMAYMDWDEDYLASHARSLGSRPIRVLTSGNHGVGRLPVPVSLQTPEHQADERAFTAAQAKWLSLSSDAKQIMVPNSSEYIQFDAPDAVVDAVHDVYSRSRRPGQ